MCTCISEYQKLAGMDNAAIVHIEGLLQDVPHCDTALIDQLSSQSTSNGRPVRVVHWREGAHQVPYTYSMTLCIETSDIQGKAGSQKFSQKFSLA